MFSQILVPLDGSELAERALPYAERVAALSGATLHLVRVSDVWQYAKWDPFPPYVPPSTMDDMLAVDATNVAAYLDGVCRRLHAVATRTRHLQPVGSTAVTLLDYAREAHIDLVVMASHGRSGVARMALGSVADHLLHHGNAPLLLVHAFGTPATLERIVIPLDGSALAERALGVARMLAGPVAREATLVRAIERKEQWPKAERYLATIRRQLQAEGLRCTERVALGDPTRAILDMAGDERAIVIATHGRTGLTRVALGSVADRVARNAEAAVFLVRAGMPAAAEPAPTRAAQESGTRPAAPPQILALRTHRVRNHDLG